MVSSAVAWKPSSRVACGIASIAKTKRNPEFAAARELSPAVTKRIWLGIAILFNLIGNLPIQLKKSYESNFLWFPGKQGPEL
jgi:hypothetical protein